MGSVDRRILITGYKGMVGSAICRQLEVDDNVEVIKVGRDEVDLRNYAKVERIFAETYPTDVIVAAAKVGGILANDTFPADFIRDNILISTNLIHAAYISNTRRLINLGSSCIYPRSAPQPIPENALLDGRLEPTNEPYAIAKIAAIKLCESYRRQHGCDFRSLMPTNLYGPHDNFDSRTSHVIPGLIRRMADAKRSGKGRCEIWGTGKPQREFLYVDDLARAVSHFLSLPEQEYWAHVDSRQSHVNIGAGEDLSIEATAKKIAKEVGFEGKLVFDTSKPDGVPRKQLDVSLARQMGWEATIPLEEGLRRTVSWYLINVS